MIAQWSIHDNILCIEEASGKVVTPSAEDIYAMAVGVESSLRSIYPSLPNPLDTYPNLKISKLGSRLGLRLRLDGTKIVLNVFTRRSGACIELPFSTTKMPDHYIIDNTWVHFSGNYDSFKEMLDSCSIVGFEEITLAQYLRLIQQSQLDKSVEVVDDAENAIKNHPSFDYNSNSFLKAELYPYQKTGVSWLRFIASNRSGCILGDEMGLGKSLQIIALITERKTVSNRPSLIIAPASLLDNWMREFKKFTIGLNIGIHHGLNRTGYYKDLLEYDVIITSYGLASTDLSLFKMIDWDLVILDEAQNIKSPDAIRTKAVKSIECHSPIAVTGTPFENHILDVWSILDFVSPGILGNKNDFEKNYTDSLDGAARIELILTPLMLRRTVSEVAGDLPEKIVIPVLLNMSEKEMDDYELIRQTILNEYPENSATLVSLTKLRMYCTHPSLISKSETDLTFNLSSKYQYVCSILGESITYAEKTLIFTSYNEMFDIFEHDLTRRFNVPFFKINGSTPVKKRQEIIDSFTNVIGPAIMVLNPKAAGTGLNITAANRVIHYTPEWNPSLEDQASARAYRRGQKHTVFIYRLFYKDTVEEIVQERIEHKRDMFDAAIRGTKELSDNKEDIMRALAITPRIKQ